MPDNFNTVKNAPGIIAKAAAGILADKLQFVKSISKVNEDEYKGKNGYSAGDTIYINKPARFIATTNFDITNDIQDIKEEKVPLTLDTISTVAVDIDSFQFATEIQLKDVIKRVVEPAMETIAENIESRFLAKIKNQTFNIVGTPGSNGFEPNVILAARARMNKYLTPKVSADRFFLHDSESGRLAVDARKGLFQSSSRIKEQYEEGLVGIADGFIWLENELLPVHTNGNDNTFLVNGTPNVQGVATLNVDGLTTTTGTVTAGTVFTIANVFAVHPQTKQQYKFLQQFVVTQNVTADGGGNATLQISPAIYTAASGGLQNVSAFPQDNAAITVVSGAESTSYIQNLAFHRDAYHMVSVPLVMPTKAEVAEMHTHQGITIALIRDFDIIKRRMITRLDFLGAITAVRPEWACRLTD